MIGNKKFIAAAIFLMALPVSTPLAAQSVPVVAQLVPPVIFTPPSTPKVPSLNSVPTPAPSRANGRDEAAIEARILLQLAAGSEQDGKTLDAINLYRQVISVSEKTMSPSMDAGIAAGRLGALYADMKNLSLAMKYAKQALQTFEKFEGPVCNDVGIELNNIAWIQEQLGDKIGAERTYKQTIAVFKASADENDDLIAVACQNLGDMYRTQLRYKDAYAQFKTAQHFAQAFFGDEHPLARLIKTKLKETKRLLAQ
jgi:tetratricopeptide (TPR) repeat protein